MPNPKSNASLDTIRVRAIRDGEYDLQRRWPGDVFTLQTKEVQTQEWNERGERVGKPKNVLVTALEQLAESWMEIVPDDTPESSTTTQEALTQVTLELKRKA